MNEKEQAKIKLILGQIRELGLNMEKILKKKCHPHNFIIDLDYAENHLKQANKILTLEECNNGKRNHQANCEN
jgi:hypothetical protein